MWRRKVKLLSIALRDRPTALLCQRLTRWDAYGMFLADDIPDKINVLISALHAVVTDAFQPVDVHELHFYALLSVLLATSIFDSNHSREHQNISTDNLERICPLNVLLNNCISIC
jgi:hypothetical protein